MKRKDKKGRILREGESLRKDGRYVYTYTDLSGERVFIYSWKLENNDPLPAGKRKCIATDSERFIRSDYTLWR